MITRIWRGAAEPANAEAYRQHMTTRVFPALAGIDGHRGAFLLQRDHEGRVEFLAVTLWASEEALRRFAGDDLETAVVEPAAHAVLADYDDFTRLYEVAHAANYDSLLQQGG